MFTKKSDYINYLTLFEDAGWQHVWGTKSSANHYFLPKNGQTDTEIFSDVESANKRYKTLFELPFAIGRGGFFLFFLVMGTLYGYWAMKAKKEYDCHAKEKENNK